MLDTVLSESSFIVELKINLTVEQFWHLCHDNQDYRIERTATGTVIIMPPTGSEESDRNSEVNFQLRL